MDILGSETENCIADLVAANHILAHEGVVDAFGHVSARRPDKPDRFMLARSRSPELVEADDLIEFDMSGESAEGDNRKSYIERYIHAAVFEARPEANAVVHCHPDEVIPFSVTKTRLRPGISLRDDKCDSERGVI